MMLNRRLGTSASLAAGVIAALVALSPGTAAAYCRSTTCTGDCPRDADGCKTTGVKLFWASSCVGFSLQKDSSIHIPFKYFEQATQASFLSWTQLECADGPATMAFSQLDNVACNKTEYNKSGTNSNIILFQDYKWKYQGVDNTLAKTTVTFNDETGEILDADIEINHANNHFTISDMVIDYDLQAVLTHEIGHFIGLDHTPDFSATMYAGYEPGTIDQRTLEEDDVLAACEVYPATRPAKCDPTPRGGVGNDCGGVANDTTGAGGGGADGDSGDSGCSTCATALRSASGGGSGWGAIGAGLALAAVLRRRPRAHV